jgi:hypothetical protein
MNRPLLNYALFIFCSIAFICPTDSLAADDHFDYGKIEKGKYVNSFFNIEMTLRKDWHPLSKESSDYLIKRSIDMISQNSEVMGMMVKAAEVNTAYLLTVFQYEMGSPVPFNPSMLVMSENLRLAPGVKTGSDYLYHSRKALEMSGLPYSFTKKAPESLELAGLRFDAMAAELQHPGMLVHQEYYCAIERQFSLCFILSFTEEEQVVQLRQMMDSLRRSAKSEKK